MRLVDRAMLETTWAAAVLCSSGAAGRPWMPNLTPRPGFLPQQWQPAAFATVVVRAIGGALRTSSDEGAVGSAGIGRKSGS